MKNVIQVLSIILIPTAFMISCGDEEADCAATCQNGGTCVADTCQCPAGYVGTSCQTLQLAPFLATYIIDNESCSGGGQGAAYTIEVTANSTSGLHMNIANIGNDGYTVVATVTSGTIISDYSVNFTIQAQQVTINGVSATVSGSGHLSTQSSNLMQYTVLMGGTTTNCTAQF